MWDEKKIRIHGGLNLPAMQTYRKLRKNGISPVLARAVTEEIAATFERATEEAVQAAIRMKGWDK